MSSTTAPTERRPNRRVLAKEATRIKVVTTARRLFDAQGFDAVTIRDISAKMGRSTGAIFAHFEGKDQLFAAVFPADHQRRRVAEGICVGLFGPQAWETASSATRDLCLQAAGRAMASVALQRKAA